MLCKICIWRKCVFEHVVNLHYMYSMKMCLWACSEPLLHGQHENVSLSMKWTFVTWTAWKCFFEHIVNLCYIDSMKMCLWACSEPSLHGQHENVFWAYSEPSLHGQHENVSEQLKWPFITWTAWKCVWACSEPSLHGQHENVSLSI